MNKISTYRGAYNPQEERYYKLSRSKIELYVNCKRCFYLDRKLKVAQPPGFPFNLNSAVENKSSVLRVHDLLKGLKV